MKKTRLMLGTLRAGLMAACSAASVATATAAVTDAADAAVAAALHRPAVAVRQPARAVMLAIAAAGSRLVAVGERGIVLLSDDGGLQWRQTASPTSVSLTALRFADERHGAAVGHGGTVMTTADAGATWQRRMDGVRIAALALEAARAQADPAALKDAERLVADGPDKPLLDVLMFDAQRLLVVGAYGLALYSQDGGEHWTPWAERLENPKGLHLYALRRHGDALLIVGEQGLLMRSTDGGRSFTRIAAPYAGSYFTAEMLSASEWVVAGLRGNVWRTVDAGARWSRLAQASAVESAATVTASTRSADGSVLIAGQAGVVWQLQGDRLVALPGAAFPPLAGLLAMPDGKFVTVGLGGVLGRELRSGAALARSADGVAAR